jgi:hypothetical protein
VAIFTGVPAPASRKACSRGRPRVRRRLSQATPPTRPRSRPCRGCGGRSSPLGQGVATWPNRHACRHPSPPDVEEGMMWDGLTRGTWRRGGDLHRRPRPRGHSLARVAAVGEVRVFMASWPRRRDVAKHRRRSDPPSRRRARHDVGGWPRVRQRYSQASPPTWPPQSRPCRGCKPAALPTPDSRTRLAHRNERGDDSGGHR